MTMGGELSKREGVLFHWWPSISKRSNKLQLFYTDISLIQTEAERRRREAGVKQSMEIRVRSCMYVCGYVWYLELSREPRHVAQQTRYQNVDLGNGHCVGTISLGCDF